MARHGVQPANHPLAYYLSIPQWRCSRGHWNDVSRIVQRCYGCCDEAEPCPTCGGDGEFDDVYGYAQCDACAGWGVKWDWPAADEPVPQHPSPDAEPF